MRAGRAALRFGITFSVSVLLAAAQFKPAAPQPHPQVEQEEPPTFTARVNLVRILATVRDSAGTIITNLAKSDFSLTDSGVPQSVAVFERNTSLPLSVAILVDTSGSTNISLPYETRSIRRFVNALTGDGNPEDAFALFSFNWRTNLEIDFTRNPKRANIALKALRGDGGTSLYDAMFLASDTLTSRGGRHVMIIVTDGGDTTSYKKYDEALAAAQQVDAIVYPIVVVPVNADAGRNLGGEHALATLAASTGGRSFSPQGTEEIDQSFQEIIRELRTQYLLGFYPQGVPQQPRRYHDVQIQTPSRNLRISARSGYYEP